MLATIAPILAHFPDLTVAVVGDLIVDRYTEGTTGRISPEAPVPVLHMKNEHERPGGAGNVALNIAALGAKTFLLGRLGDDSAGHGFIRSLEKEGVNCSAIAFEEGYSTPVKNRLLASGQQMLRIDHEVISPLRAEAEREVLSSLKKMLPSVDVVAISDYGKGVLTSSLLAELLELAQQYEVPVVVDPHGNNYQKYHGCHLLKPNQKEAYLAAQSAGDAPLDAVAQELLQQSGCANLLITRASEGMALYREGGERSDYATKALDVTDVTGAGDTVLAVMALAVAAALPMEDAIPLANTAARKAVQTVGCARVSLYELTAEVLSLSASNKVFTHDHIDALQLVLKGQSYVIVEMNLQEVLTADEFIALKQLRAHRDYKVVAYIAGATRDSDYIAMLASLVDLDFIIIDSVSIQILCDTVAPVAIFRPEAEKGALEKWLEQKQQKQSIG